MADLHTQLASAFHQQPKKGLEGIKLQAFLIAALNNQAKDNGNES